jgi:hypothetical protein
LHDANGNVTFDNGLYNTYEYDAENRPVTVKSGPTP